MMKKTEPMMETAGNKSATMVYMIPLFVVMLILAPVRAFAYIDPGTGSFLVQGVIAAVVGAGVVVKMFWGRIKSAITGKPILDDDDDE